MKMQILKQMITTITFLVQVFCVFWFLARGFVGIILMIYNWQSTATPLAELLSLFWTDSTIFTQHDKPSTFYG